MCVGLGLGGGGRAWVVRCVGGTRLGNTCSILIFISMKLFEFILYCGALKIMCF